MWAEDVLFALHLETTGSEPETAQLVTAQVAQVQPERRPLVREWLTDPTVEHRAEATVERGVTGQIAQVRTQSIVDVLIEIDGELADAYHDGFPIVAFNAAFDLTVLDRELRRHGIDENGLGPTPPVIDPLVLDRACDRFRRGQRQLNDVCQHYRVPFQYAHDASADALAVAQLATVIADRFPIIGATEPTTLHAVQQRAHRAWAKTFESRLRSVKDKEGASDTELASVAVNSEWPMCSVAHAGLVFGA